MKDTVLITGASQGIGLATAVGAARRGFDVIGVARKRPSDFPGDFFELDLEESGATEKILGTLARKRHIDGLVNCVGLSIPAHLEEVKLQDAMRVFQFNVLTTILCTQLVLDGMKSRGYGRIVNISSRGALGRSKRTSYGAAKAAILGMTRTWALELAQYGITANVVSPGPIETAMLRRNNFAEKGDELEQVRRIAEIPMQRIGEPSEVAEAILFFLSRGASYITGQNLYVCGGGSVGSRP